MFLPSTERDRSGRDWVEMTGSNGVDNPSSILNINCVVNLSCKYLEIQFMENMSANSFVRFTQVKRAQCQKNPHNYDFLRI